MMFWTLVGIVVFAVVVCVVVGITMLMATKKTNFD